MRPLAHAALATFAALAWLYLLLGALMSNAAPSDILAFAADLVAHATLVKTAVFFVSALMWVWIIVLVYRSAQ